MLDGPKKRVITGTMGVAGPRWADLDVPNYIAAATRGLSSYSGALALTLVQAFGHESTAARNFPRLAIKEKVALVAFQNWSKTPVEPHFWFTPILVLREWKDKPGYMPKTEDLDPEMLIPFWHGTKGSNQLYKSEIPWRVLETILYRQKSTVIDGFLPRPVQTVKYIEPPKDKDEGKKSS